MSVMDFECRLGALESSRESNLIPAELRRVPPSAREVSFPDEAQALIRSSRQCDPDTARRIYRYAPENPRVGSGKMATRLDEKLSN